MKKRKIIIAIAALLLLSIGGTQVYGYMRNNQANKLVNSAEQLVKEKKYSEAIAEYEKASKIKKKDLKIKMSIADTYMLNDEVDKAITILKEAITENPENKDILSMISKAYIKKFIVSNSEVDFNEAIKYYGIKESTDFTKDETLKNLLDVYAKSKLTGNPGGNMDGETLYTMGNIDSETYPEIIVLEQNVTDFMDNPPNNFNKVVVYKFKDSGYKRIAEDNLVFEGCKDVSIDKYDDTLGFFVKGEGGMHGQYKDFYALEGDKLVKKKSWSESDYRDLGNSTSNKSEFGENDHVIAGVKLNDSIETINAKLGKPKSNKMEEDPEIHLEIQTNTYEWGEIVFYKNDTEWLAEQIIINKSSMAGPRGIKVGDPLESVLAKFPDNRKNSSDEILYGVDGEPFRSVVGFISSAGDSTHIDYVYMSVGLKIDCIQDRVVSIELVQGGSI